MLSCVTKESEPNQCTCVLVIDKIFFYVHLVFESKAWHISPTPGAPGSWQLSAAPCLLQPKTPLELWCSECSHGESSMRAALEHQSSSKSHMLHWTNGAGTGTTWWSRDATEPGVYPCTALPSPVPPKIIHWKDYYDCYLQHEMLQLALCTPVESVQVL